MWSTPRLLLIALLPAHLIGLAALGGCGDDDAPAPVQEALGGLTVRVTPKPARIEVLAPDGTVLFDGLPGGAVEPGAAPHVAAAMRRTEASFEFLVGAFWIEDEQPEDVPWTGVTRLADVRREGPSVLFSLRGAGGAELGEGSITEVGPGELEITFSAADPGRGNDAGGSGPNRLSVGFSCAPDEHFLGLGGQSWDVNHRGQTVPIWVQEDGISKEADDDRPDLWPLTGTRHSTHSPMPVFLSSRGYALLLDTTYRSKFALCSEAEDVARVEAWEGTARLRLMYGPDPVDLVEKITAYLGRPALPPAFAFAPWLDAIYGEDNVRRVAERLRAEGIPVSAIWTEDWRGGSDDGVGYTLDEDWRLDREVYPSFEQLADRLHALGIKFLVYNNTFLEVGVDVWDEAVQNGYTIEDENGDPYLFTNAKFEDSSLADLTNPAAFDWVKSVYREGLEAGADGYMADYAEWLPHDAVLHSGEDAEGYHNLYPVDFQRLNRELFDELEAVDGVQRLFFVRSAYLGSQPLVSVFWAGDQQTDFSLGDGLPSVIPMGIGLGLTGFPYYGHDIAGYMSQLTAPATKELWFRWASLGALSPVMRTHHGKSARDNWSWESDAETVAHLKRWATLHLRLFPYLYGLAAQAADTGLPMMRPFALGYPGWEPGWSLTDQFLLGDRIAVAPVIEQGATERVVELPEGTWYPLQGGAPLEMPYGGGNATVDAPLTECPAFVPAGSVLVLLPEGVDTLVTDTTLDATVTSQQDAGDDRELWVYPGGSSSWTEVDGLSYQWVAPSLSGPITTATLDGSALAVEPAAPATPLASGPTVTVTGNGTLTINESATLQISGGDEARRVVVRFVGMP